MYYFKILIFMVFFLTILGGGIVLGNDWKGNSSDNICGLSNPKHITNPAIVDYNKVYNAASPIKKMKKEGIDPSSAKGSELIAEATREIGKACRIVMSNKNLDSVWKKITSKAGKIPKDITNEVIKLL